MQKLVTEIFILFILYHS